jgi:hypothetical protein
MAELRELKIAELGAFKDMVTKMMDKYVGEIKPYMEKDEYDLDSKELAAKELIARKHYNCSKLLSKINEEIEERITDFL